MDGTLAVNAAYPFYCVEVQKAIFFTLPKKINIAFHLSLH